MRATGNRENTSDGLGRNLTRSERPHSSVIKINPTRPGSACLVNMLVSSSRLPDAPSGKAARPNSPTEDDDQKQDRSAVSTRDSPTAKPSVIDRIYGVPGITGVMAHIDLQREKRTRSVKRSLKRLRLPVGLYVSGDNPAQKSQTYQVFPADLSLPDAIELTDKCPSRRCNSIFDDVCGGGWMWAPGPCAIYRHGTCSSADWRFARTLFLHSPFLTPCQPFCLLPFSLPPLFSFLVLSFLACGARARA